MAIRVAVKCLSELIPGDPKDRRQTMANIICQFRFGRDLDASRDGLQSTGQCAVNGERCHFLVDIGPKGAGAYDVYWYKWDGKKLIEQAVTPPLLWHLEKYEFNPSTKPVFVSDSEYKAYFGEEKFKDMITKRIEKLRRWGLPLSRDEEQFLRECQEEEAAVSASKV